MKKAKLDGVIGIRAQDRRMGGTDESTELWGHLNQNCLLDYGTTFRWVSGHWTTFYIPGPILASLCLFSPIPHYNSISNWQKRRYCAWESNSGPKDGRCRRDHRARVASLIDFCILTTWRFALQPEKLTTGTVVVAQLVERSLRTPEICSLSPVIYKFYSLSTVLKSRHQLLPTIAF